MAALVLRTKFVLPYGHYSFIWTIIFNLRAGFLMRLFHPIFRLPTDLQVPIMCHIRAHGFTRKDVTS